MRIFLRRSPIKLQNERNAGLMRKKQVSSYLIAGQLQQYWVLLQPHSKCQSVSLGPVFDAAEKGPCLDSIHYKSRTARLESRSIYQKERKKLLLTYL